MDINNLLRTDPLGFKICNIPSKSREYYLTVTAGKDRYSTPAEDLHTANYTAFEVIIYDKDRNRVTHKVSSVLFPIIGEQTEMNLQYITQEQIWACVDAL